MFGVKTAWRLRGVHGCACAAMLVFGAAWAQSSAPVAGAAGFNRMPRPGGLISTHAVSHRRLANTASDVSVSIEVHARDLQGASTLLAVRSQALLTYLRGQHAERLRSEQVSVDPETQEVRGHPDRVIGYTGYATVSFRTTPEAMPALLAGSLDHGANSLQSSGSSPREEEIQQARLELAAEATKVALAQARAVADAAGERVVEIAQIDVDPGESGVAQPMSAMAPKMAMSVGRATPPIATEAGEADISLQVVVTVRVERPN